MIFVFDKHFHTVPTQGDICTGFYYEKANYLPNIAAGQDEVGILGHGSLFLDIFHSGQEYDTILTDDITDETDLLYLIEPWPVFNGLKEKYQNILHPKHWHLTLKHIPEKILQLAREGRLTILLHIPEYTHSAGIVKETIASTRSQLNIPNSRFKFISGMIDPDFYFWPGFEYSQLQCYGHTPQIKSLNLSKRKYKFTCLNRLDKIHRRYVGLKFWETGMRNAGYFSYSMHDFTYNGLEKIEHDHKVNEFGLDWGITPERWEKFHNAGPFRADRLDIDQHNHHWHVEDQHYTDAYWNFVTETGVAENTFLSEKTFKPIANLQPFIIMGDYGSLALLHDLGYKTFGDYIDESYDLVKSPVERIEQATEIGLKLALMSHDEHIELIHKLKPILEYNQQHFFRSKNRIKFFVKYIYGNKPDYNWLKDCKYD